ncbi:hypothetical protein QFZ48_005062 [Chitinophaga sp. W2I13]
MEKLDGRQQFDIQMSDIQPGMYLLVLKAPGKQLVKKIVKM